MGLIGMGGSGKTTLAKVVFQSMFKDFEKSSYLDDVKSKATLDEVLVTLLRQFGIKNRRTGGDALQSNFENSYRSYSEDFCKGA
jgi:ABC-type glutathione transport system ATPase component